MPDKTALIVRHVPFEGIAGYRQPVEAAGYRIERVDVDDPVFASLDLSAPDLLIMMGGPMGVYEQQRHPWIAGQLRRLGQRLRDDRPTLGVCFGAQMIAAALGAQVYRGPVREVGFHPIAVQADAADNPLRHLVGVPVLHWHGDTFTLPDDVELLATSHVYRHQAFRRGNNILALQFHAEMGTDPRFEAWLTEWPGQVVEAGNDPETLRLQHRAFGTAAAAAGQAMIAGWLESLQSAANHRPLGRRYRDERLAA